MLRFSASRISMVVTTFTTSVIITAVLEKYMSPGSVRVYLIVNMREAF